jgi:hypothetical protein
MSGAPGDQSAKEIPLSWQIDQTIGCTKPYMRWSSVVREHGTEFGRL